MFSTGRSGHVRRAIVRPDYYIVIPRVQYIYAADEARMTVVSAARARARRRV